MKKLVYIFLAIGIPFYTSCVNDPIETLQSDPNVIKLKWNQSYPNEKMEDAVTGLFWALSHCGAKNTSLNTSAIITDSNTIILNLYYLGFIPNALNNMASLHESIQSSEEYKNNNSVDIGRYITLLIGASNHYYQITGVPLTLKEQLSNYKLVPDSGYVNNSTISNQHRTIKFSALNNLNQLLISTEFDSISGEILEFETMELMENGQYKFAIFDADSQRINSAPRATSNAGKPAKCMWCHESKINPTFAVQKDSTGFLTYQQLQDTLLHLRSKVSQVQNSIQSGVDFSNNQEHTQMELQYIMFMLPSPLRLSNEWGRSQNEVLTLLANEKRTLHPEFSFLPAGYTRMSVERFSPHKGLVTSSLVREESAYEVSYIN